MNYNPANAALAFIDQTESLIVRNFAGETVWRAFLNETEENIEIQSLLATGLMIKIDKCGVLINPDHVARIYYTDHNQMMFESAEGETIAKFNWNREDADNFFESVARHGFPYIMVPGLLDYVSVRALSDIRMNNQHELEFLTHSGKILSTSKGATPDFSKSLLALGKAGIAACQAARPAPVAAKAAPMDISAPAPTKAEEKQALKNLAHDLKQVVFEQDDAIDVITDAVLRAKAGLQEENKPVGSFLLLGPTGVGKTETCMQLAKKLGIPFKKFDMSEFMEKHSVARLIGSPPGYVGMEAGAQLCDFVHKNPRCVLDFDEIEKAHPDVANILLQVLDDAKLTDGQGNTVDFSQAIIIMTSNLGTRKAIKPSIGFVQSSDEPASLDARGDKAVGEHFLPEFLNRVTAVVRYNPLSKDGMLRLVDKFMGELKGRSAKKDVTLTTTPEAEKYLAKEGYDEIYGARPLKRLIENEVSTPLAREILFGKLQNGGQALLKFENDKLSYLFNDATGIANDNTAAASNVKALRTMQGPNPI